MLIHVPDPDYVHSERARVSFRLALQFALGFVAVIWFVQLLSWGLGLGLERYGVRPREPIGLLGILLAPLLHGSPAHLIANTVPLLVLLTLMLQLYPNSALKVIPAIYFGPGIAVWLFARGSDHIGASGLVYGLLSYIFVAGVLRRDRRAIGASLLTWFLYGSLVWGVLPIQEGVSWETHLSAALIGLALALALRRLDVPPRKRYSWEDEEIEQAAQDEEQNRTDESSGSG